MCCTLEQKLFLEPEEAHLVTTTCCSTQTQRRPYGELQAVEHLKCLGCCHCFQFAETKVSPQCFCAEDLVGEIVKELKTRMKARGDTGNIKRAEQTIDMVGQVQKDVADLNLKIDAIIAHLNITVPEKMER